MAGSIEVSTKKGKKRNLEKLAPRTEEQLRSRLEKAGGLTIELVAKTGDGQLLKTMPLAMRGFATGSVGFALGESLHLTLTSGEDEMEQPLSLYCTTNCEPFLFLFLNSHYYRLLRGTGDG